ncbi:copper resistance CopC family protein [Kocuria nitroreducens]|uniref:copper resistance CopC family protein n=1 Tax=Kocuria nitroreducens TaxID=3058914 RepID=UPI0036DA20B9
MPTPTLRRTAALLTAGALTILPLLPASAHDELTAVSPEPDSVLTTAPEEIELTFSGEVMDIGHQILVTDSEGRSVTDGPLEPEGNRIVQPLTGAGTDDETYRVVWRVVSSDGHPIEGTFTYDVGSGLEPTADPSAAVEDSADRAQGVADRASSGNVPLWLVAVAGGAVALAVLGLVSLVSSRRRKG